MKELSKGGMQCYIIDPLNNGPVSRAKRVRGVTVLPSATEKQVSSRNVRLSM
jgi:hypothetical protein